MVDKHLVVLGPQKVLPKLQTRAHISKTLSHDTLNAALNTFSPKNAKQIFQHRFLHYSNERARLHYDSERFDNFLDLFLVELQVPLGYFLQQFREKSLKFLGGNDGRLT